MNDRRFTIKHIDNVMIIFRVKVENFLHNEFDMREFCSRLVPRILTHDQKRTVWLHHWHCFFKCFVTQDMCWIHYFEPKAKRQSKWQQLCWHASKNVMVVSSTGKLMESFLGCKRNYVYWLSTKGPHHQWRVLCKLSEVVKKVYQDGTQS